MRTFYRFFASCFFISYIPASILKNTKFTGAGLLGTLWAVPFLFLLPENVFLYTGFLIIFFLFGVYVSHKAKYDIADDPRIVIDEALGFFAAMFMLPKVWWVIAIAFVLFRIIDTIKPFGIKKLDAVKNAWGVMLDDLAGGVAANILTRIIILLILYTK